MRMGFFFCPSPRAAAKAADEVLLLQVEEDGAAVGADPGGLASEEGVQEGLPLGPGQGVAGLDGGQAGQAGEKPPKAPPLPLKGLPEDLRQEEGVGVEEGRGREEADPARPKGLKGEEGGGLGRLFIQLHQNGVREGL
jgi:hypothetical protein